MVVKSVDAEERTCTVKFIDGGSERKVFNDDTKKEDENKKGEEEGEDEEISVYDLQPLEELSLEPGM